MTSKMLLEQYMEERRALGFSLKTDEGCIRRFLQDFVDPDDGDISETDGICRPILSCEMSAQSMGFLIL